MAISVVARSSATYEVGLVAAPRIWPRLLLEFNARQPRRLGELV